MSKFWAAYHCVLNGWLSAQQALIMVLVQISLLLFVATCIGSILVPLFVLNIPAHIIR